MEILKVHTEPNNWKQSFANLSKKGIQNKNFVVVTDLKMDGSNFQLASSFENVAFADCLKQSTKATISKLHDTMVNDESKRVGVSGL